MQSQGYSERYHRQLILPQFGPEAQQRLQRAKVLVVGAGGLGCPALLYLAAAGVGTIGIVDGDAVSLSNLHRQVLYTTADIGQPKAAGAARLLQAMNPDTMLLPFAHAMNNGNALDLIEGFDLVLDATDNFPTRYLINDACVLLGKPLVFGAVSRYEGQVAVFNVQADGEQRAIHYRDLFPAPPREGEVANCAEAGVLGVLPGIIGTLQAGEALKLITGIGQPLAGRLQIFHWLRNEWHDWEITPLEAAESGRPRTREVFREWPYEEACSLEGFAEIGAQEFEQLLAEEGVTVIDVREPDELPALDGIEHRSIPLGNLKQGGHTFDKPTLVAVCQSGKRSRVAAEWLATSFPGKKIFSLRSGLSGWRQHLSNPKA
ncbi:MAG TPA: HesA/MoeB/ThiF family protein [Chitinophagaceae bacterium]|jgi:adenylyltransferase/sulfurtransferase|nr:HesA/MoeB/ThiF family protein [Chitinophagaceae bacterium]